MVSLASLTRLGGALGVAVVVLLTNAPSAQAVWPVPLQGSSRGEAQAAAGLPAPTGVASACVGLLSGQVLVSWLPVSHASSYTVYAATAQAGPYVAVALPTSSPWTSPVLGLSGYWFEVSASVGTNWASTQSLPTDGRLIVAGLACL
jgi:hypothetical protein